MREWEREGMRINILLREGMGMFLYYYGNGMEIGIRSWEWEGMESNLSRTSLLATHKIFSGLLKFSPDV